MLQPGGVGGEGFILGICTFDFLIWTFVMLILWTHPGLTCPLWSHRGITSVFPRGDHPVCPGPFHEFIFFLIILLKHGGKAMSDLHWLNFTEFLFIIYFVGFRFSVAIVSWVHFFELACVLKRSFTSSRISFCCIW